MKFLDDFTFISICIAVSAILTPITFKQLNISEVMPHADIFFLVSVFANASLLYLIAKGIRLLFKKA